MTYKGAITSDVEKNTSEIIFFLGFIVEFFRQVVVVMSDVEPQKVKTYLFLQGSDLTFRGSAQVVLPKANVLPVVHGPVSGLKDKNPTNLPQL